MQQYCPSRRDGETRLIVSGTGGVEVAAFLSTFALAASVRAKVRRSLPRHREVGASTLTIYDGFPHVMQMAREEVRGRVWDDTLAWLKAHAEAGDEEEALEDETSPSARLVG